MVLGIGLKTIAIGAGVAVGFIYRRPIVKRIANLDRMVASKHLEMSEKLNAFVGNCECISVDGNVDSVSM